MPSFEKKNFRILAVGLAFASLPAFNWLCYRLVPPPVSPSRLSRATIEDAAREAGFLTLGMRRLAADLDFIRLLIDYGGGAGPDLKNRALRILDVDPNHSTSALLASGALAFNLGRPGEALEVLREAARLQPEETRYPALAVAVAARMSRLDPSALDRLTEALSSAAPSPRIKHLLAFYNSKAGRTEAAARLYKELLASRDPEYSPLAQAALQDIDDSDR